MTLPEEDDTLRSLEVKGFAAFVIGAGGLVVLAWSEPVSIMFKKFPSDIRKAFSEDIKPLVYRMRGGPTCLFLPDPAAPAVSVQAWFRVGSLTETAPLEGISHFLEHMIFKGSENLEVGELASMAESSGGDINAYTTNESTHYDLISMPDKFEGCLEALLDALWWPRFEEDEIRQERQVILSEFNRTYEQPDQLLQYHLYREAYGPRHPYGRAILGTRQTLKSIDAAGLKKYHKQFYTPSSAVLVFAGAFDVPRVKSILRKRRKRFLTKWPKPGRRKMPKVPLPTPLKAGPRIVVRRGRSGTAHVELAFEIPPLTHRDAPVLEVLGIVLGAGESSRLYEHLCMDTSLMFDVSADVYLSGGPGLFFLGGYAMPENVEQAIEQILHVAKQIIEDRPLTPDELDKVRMNYLTGLEFRREGMTGRARVAGYSELITGDPNYHLNYMKMLLEVDANDVSDVARRYLSPSRLTAGVFLPKGEAPRVGVRKIRNAIWSGFENHLEQKRNDANRNQGIAEKSAASRRTRSVSPQRSYLKNTRRSEAKNTPIETKLPGGGRLVMLPDSGPPVFSMRAVFLGGQRNESARQAGLHALMMSAAPMATERCPSFIHTKEVEGLGASIDGFSGRNTFGLTASGLSAVMPEVMERFVELLSAPAFDKDDIEFARAELNAERDSELDDLGQWCRFKGYQLLYGKHPLGRHPLGTTRTMAAFNQRVLRREWRKRTSPANLVIAAAGNFDVSYLEEHLPEMLKPWAASDPPETPVLQLATPKSLSRRRYRSYELDGASQSHIHMSFLGTTFHDPARHALAIISAALGSQAGGLFLELREKRGLAYDVGVSSYESLDPGPISIYAATSAGMEKLAIDLMRQEIARVSCEGLDDEEFQRAKSYLIGGLSRAHQRAFARAADLAGRFTHGLGWETLEETKRQIERVEMSAVTKTARHYMKPSKECLVIVSGNTLK